MKPIFAKKDCVDSMTEFERRNVFEEHRQSKKISVEVRMHNKKSLLDYLNLEYILSIGIGLIAIAIAIAGVGCGMDNYNMRRDSRVDAMMYLDNAWNRQPAYYPTAPSQYNAAPQAPKCRTSYGTYLPCHLAN